MDVIRVYELFKGEDCPQGSRTGFDGFRQAIFFVRQYLSEYIRHTRLERALA